MSLDFMLTKGTGSRHTLAQARCLSNCSACAPTFDTEDTVRAGKLASSTNPTLSCCEPPGLGSIRRLRPLELGAGVLAGLGPPASEALGVAASLLVSRHANRLSASSLSIEKSRFTDNRSS